MQIQAPKGTKDVLPGESYKWQYIEKEMRDLCRLYGINELRTPIIEHTELFMRGVERRAGYSSKGNVHFQG